MDDNEFRNEVSELLYKYKQGEISGDEYLENIKKLIHTNKAIDEQPIIKRDHPLKVFLLNTAGVILGFIASVVSYYILRFVLINILGNIPIIPKLISWPCDYSYYALCTMTITSALIGNAVCAYLCNIAKTKYNYGVVFFSVISAVFYLATLILSFKTNGFVFWLLLIFIFTIIAYLLGIQNAENENNDYDNNGKAGAIITGILIAIVSIYMLIIAFLAQPTTDNAATDETSSTYSYTYAYETSSETDTSTIVYITESGTKYHRSSCQYLSKSKIQTIVKKALQSGYEPCNICNPPKQ